MNNYTMDLISVIVGFVFGYVVKIVVDKIRRSL
jgi:hypothetical protein